MAEVKHIPAIRFKGFSDEWENRKLKEIAESFEYGLNAAAIEFDGINKYIRITDIDDQTHQFKKNALTSPDADLIFADNYMLKEGDILFARTGASVGKTYNYRDSDGLVYFAGFLIRARIKSEFNTEFIFQSTLTSAFNKFISITSQRSGQPGINAQEYSEFNVKVPNFKEQQKVGRYFQHLDKLISLHQAKVNKLVNLKKAMLEKMFPKSGAEVPEIRFKGFEGAWGEKELSDVVKIKMGQSPNGINYTNNPDDHILVQGNADMKNGMVVPRAWTKQVTKKADAGDLIMSVRAPVGELGKTSFDVVIGRGVAAIKGNEFVFQLLKKMNENGYWKRFSAGSTFDSINSNELSKAVISVTNIDEQEKIGTYFQSLDKLVNLHQTELDKLDNLKKACLEKMFV